MSIPSTLKLDVEGSEWLHTDEIVHDACRVGIVSAIVKLINRSHRVFKILVPLKQSGVYNHKEMVVTEELESIVVSLQHSTP